MADGLPDPGFYEDPQDPQQERWWNGRIWVGQTRPATGRPPLSPTDEVPSVGTSQSTMSVEEKAGDRSAYYVMAWIGVLLCLPMAIVFNLMDNSVCKARGLQPTFGPTLAALGLGMLLAAYYAIGN